MQNTNFNILNKHNIKIPILGYLVILIKYAKCNSISQEHAYQLGFIVFNEMISIFGVEKR